MLDAVRLEQLGVPTVTFVTEPFLRAARTHARIHGVPDMPLIVIPSQDCVRVTDASLTTKIGPLVGDVVRALLGFPSR